MFSYFHGKIIFRRKKTIMSEFNISFKDVLCKTKTFLGRKRIPCVTFFRIKTNVCETEKKKVKI